MPLIKEWHVNANARAAIWKVEEEEDFFRHATGLSPAIAAEKRRIEHLAGRFLLQMLAPGISLKEIQKDEHGKPRVPDNLYYFSISHSWPFVAVMVNDLQDTGIDIQTPRSNIEKLKDKYLSMAEQELLLHTPANFLLAWCAKEAAFKWNGKKEVAFIEQLPITQLTNETLEITMPLHAARPLLQLAHHSTSYYACVYVRDVQFLPFT